MSQIRDCFISRYNNGVIMEADFSQLEVIYLAHICSDQQLIDDLNSGMDLHIVAAAELFGIPESDVTEAQRKVAKAFRFMLQYGAGARHMAEETGHSKKVAQAFIDNYYARYPKVREWQDANIEFCEKNKKVNASKKTSRGYPVSEATILSETGRRYVFSTSDSPQWMADRGVYTSFLPTKIKNYPVQGGATGDIVPMMIGKVHRWLYDQGAIDNVKMIATVHDSIVLDVPTECINWVGEGIKKVMESAPEVYEQTFGIPFNLALKVEVKYGRSWGELSNKI